MQVFSPNNVKIYNLSQGKSLPEFLSDSKKRSLLKNDVTLRKRIELIQDFSMPTVSTSVKVTKDGNYVYAAGTYKPRIRCFDVNQLSLKFERCLDAEVSAFEILSDDYSKIALLLNDRHIEFHSQEGRWYRVRMPKFGRDLRYHPANCDLYLVGAGPEIYRLNLSRGQFLKSFVTDATEINVCDINNEHNLLAVGTADGKVECWDPRSRQRVGILDCALSATEDKMNLSDCPEITALKFKGPLHMSVGTSKGQILLYDIRTSKPYVTKDHYYDLPIHSIDFNHENGLVISSDQRCVKLWEENTGVAVTAIEPEHDINSMNLVKNTGLVFLANESPTIQSYFIPMLGPAPKWASFLDSLTEELEENPTQELYDDFKFVTVKELESLGLSNLVGSSLLRAYMHGYFMDMRLYNKAKAIANPFAYNDYRKKKIQEKIEESRTNRVQIKKLPKVNRGLAERLIDQSEETKFKSGKKKKQKKEAETLLSDSRFKAIFENPEFEINEESEEFQLLNPVITKKMEKLNSRKNVGNSLENSDDQQEIERRDSDLSSDDEATARWIESKTNDKDMPDKKPATPSSKTKMYQLKSSAEFYTMKDLDKVKKDELRQRRRVQKASIEERIKEGESAPVKNLIQSYTETTFTVKRSKKNLQREEEQRKHREERRQNRRKATTHLPRIKNRPLV